MIKAHSRLVSCLLLAVLLAQVARLHATAQGVAELETLKSAVSNMERTIFDLKEKIRQIEQRQSPATEVVPAAAQESTPSAVPARDKATAPVTRQPADDLADRTSPMRHRETIAGDNLAAPRPGNAPIDPSYAGFMPLFGTKTWVRLGGYAKVDAIMDSTKIGNPNKFVTGSIPVTGEPTFNSDEEFNLIAKQTRLSVELRSPAQLGALRVYYENDFAGGGSATDMEYNLRHLYGQMANLTVGQTWTAFFDPDALPDTLDFAGPGMQSVVRQPQVRYTFTLPRDGMHAALSIEQPKSDVVALPAGTTTRNKMPDFAANWRLEGKPGHVQVSGLLRSLAYDNPVGPDDSELGGGVDVSGVLHTWGQDGIVARFTLWRRHRALHAGLGHRQRRRGGRGGQRADSRCLGWDARLPAFLERPLALGGDLQLLGTRQSCGTGRLRL